MVLPKMPDKTPEARSLDSWMSPCSDSHPKSTSSDWSVPGKAAIHSILSAKNKAAQIGAVVYPWHLVVWVQVDTESADDIGSLGHEKCCKVCGTTRMGCNGKSSFYQVDLVCESLLASDECYRAVD